MAQARQTGRPAAAASDGEAAAGAAGDRLLRDPEVPELGRRLRGGRESWVLQLGQGAARRRFGLGPCATLSAERARALARDLLDAGDGAAPPDPAMRLAAFAPVFLADCAAQWKPATLRTNRNALGGHILPELGARRIGELDRAAVVAWMAGTTLSKGGRNRALSVLSALCVHAERRGLRPPGSNPCRGMRRHQTGFAALCLDAAGYAALGRALDALAGAWPRETAALRFIALTGCRRGEALGLEWAAIEGNRAALPDSKTGPRTLWLGRAARRHLAACPRRGAHVFGDAAGPMSGHRLALLWARVRAELGMPRLRIHDLRHSFASAALGLGQNLTVIGGLLGHADRGVTAGYAHLDEAGLRDASARVGAHLETALRRPPSRRPGRDADADPCAAFIRSGATLTGFCAERGLDPDAFRRRLVRWRKARARKGAAR